MFGKRCDGTKLKKADPFTKIIPHFMPHRYDAQVFFVNEIRCEGMDEFIKEKAEEGLKFNYMHIVIASLVRMYALKPRLNRFVMNGRIFARKGIYISFAVKKNLTEKGAETTIKMQFKGTESIFEIKDMVDKAIKENTKTEEKNNTDKQAKMLTKMPNWLLKIGMGFIRFFDRHGLLGKKTLDTSPFHTSCFLVNMKSLNTGYVLHHLYDFGTTSQFVSMGKEKLEPSVNPLTDKLEVAKIMKMGINIDERICDGLYNAHAIKVGTNFIANPKLLEEGLTEIVKDDEV